MYDGVGEEGHGFEWVHPDEGLEVNQGVLEGDQGEAQLALDTPQLRRQGLVRLGHAQLHLVQRQFERSEVVPPGGGGAGDEGSPLRLVSALVDLFQLVVRASDPGEPEGFEDQLLFQVKRQVSGEEVRGFKNALTAYFCCSLNQEYTQSDTYS